MHVKQLIGIACISAILVLAGCGGSSEPDQAQLKQETIQLETASTEVDSTVKAIQQTSAELDELLQQLEAPQQ